MVPFGERSLREEKKQEKTPAQLADEAKQHKLAQINTLLNKLHSTQQPSTTTHTPHQPQPTNDDTAEAADSEESVEAALMSLMGLPVRGFDSTKGKEVKDGNVSGVKVATQRKFKQVMKNNKGQPIHQHTHSTARTRQHDCCYS